MADGIILSTNIGVGSTIKTDDDGTFHWQLVKVAFGGDNTQTEVTASVGLPTILLAGTAEFGKLAAGTAEIGNVKNSGTFPVQSTLSAETTKIIGTINIAAAQTVAVTNAGTFAVQAAIDELPAAAALTDNFTNPTTSQIGSFNMVWDGATWDRAPGSAADGLLVNLGSNNDVAATLSAETTKVIGTINVAAAQTIATTNAGTFAVQSTLQAGTAAFGKLSANSGVDIGDVDVLSIAAGTNLLGKISIDQVTANANEVVTKTGSLVQLEAGTAGIGKLTANSGVDIGDVDVTSISAGSNLIGDVGLSGARTSGGTTIFRSIDLDEGTLEVVKASAGQIYWMHAINLASTPVFVKIYNATSGTIGTGTPVLTFTVPSQGDANGAGFTLSIPNGIAFSTGISIGASTGVADADTGAPATNTCIVNLGFA